MDRAEKASLASGNLMPKDASHVSTVKKRETEKLIAIKQPLLCIMLRAMSTFRLYYSTLAA